MKDNLENAFKQSLEEYEVAYDPKAWDAVNAQMNANAAGGSLMTSALKWMLAIVLFGTVVTGSYFLWNNEDAVEITETSIVEKGNKIENTAVQQGENDTNETVITDSSKEVEAVELTETKKDVLTEVKPTKNPIQKNQKNKLGEEVQKSEGNSADVKKTQTVVPNNKVKISKNYIAGNISNAIVCIGETIEILNPSASEKVRFKMNGKWIVLQPNKSYLFSPKESVQIDFVNDKNELLETKYIKVHDSSIPDFNLEANIFEDGMPVVIAEAFGDYSNYFWKFDDEAEAQGAVVRHHFFEKGDYEITLSVVDQNGCESTNSKTVRIRDKYNLMAMDAFKPNGSDVRNRTFMPYSLTERDVRFQLTIVDPIDNGIIFSSNDAENAWDGSDQRTGKMTPSNKAFIWKVQIFNPAPNERPIYAGTVIHN